MFVEFAALRILRAERQDGHLQDGLSVNIVLNGWNHPHLLKMMRFFYETVGIDDLRVNFIRPEGYAEGDAELTARYDALGGTSPLAARTEAQRAALIVSAREQRARDLRGDRAWVLDVLALVQDHGSQSDLTQGLPDRPELVVIDDVEVGGADQARPGDGPAARHGVALRPVAARAARA